MLASNKMRKEVQSALSKTKRNKKRNILAAACKLEIPRSTLTHHLKGRKTAKERVPVNYKLSESEERGIEAYCLRLPRIGIPICLLSIRSCANSSEEAPQKVSEMWPSRFLERHPTIAIETQHPIEIARAAATPTTTINPDMTDNANTDIAPKKVLRKPKITQKRKVVGNRVEPIAAASPEQAPVSLSCRTIRLPGQLRN